MSESTINSFTPQVSNTFSNDFTNQQVQPSVPTVTVENWKVKLGLSNLTDDAIRNLSAAQIQEIIKKIENLKSENTRLIMQAQAQEEVIKKELETLEAKLQELGLNNVQELEQAIQQKSDELVQLLSNI